METLDDLVKKVKLNLVTSPQAEISLSVSSEIHTTSLKVMRTYTFQGGHYHELAVYDGDGSEDTSHGALEKAARDNLVECLNSSHYGIDFDGNRAIVYPLEGVSVSERLLA